MKIHTIALVISKKADSSTLVDILQNEEEIQSLEVALQNGDTEPLDEVYQRRTQMSQKEAKQGDYIEDLLSKPFVKLSLQRQGILWLKSKIKLENHRKAEMDAVKVIANYAYKIFQNDPSKTDFLLAGPKTQLRIRVFPIPLKASANA